MDSNGFKWNSNRIQMEFKWTNAYFLCCFWSFSWFVGSLTFKRMCISPRAGIVKHLKIQMDSNGFKWNSNGIQMEFKWNSNGIQMDKCCILLCFWSFSWFGGSLTFKRMTIHGGPVKDSACSADTGAASSPGTWGTATGTCPLAQVHKKNTKYINQFLTVK